MCLADQHTHHHWAYIHGARRGCLRPRHKPPGTDCSRMRWARPQRCSCATCWLISNTAHVIVPSRRTDTPRSIYREHPSNMLNHVFWLRDTHICGSNPHVCPGGWMDGWMDGCAEGCGGMCSRVSSHREQPRIGIWPSISPSNPPRRLYRNIISVI
jgi:hypothetical protein